MNRVNINTGGGNIQADGSIIGINIVSIREKYGNEPASALEAIAEEVKKSGNEDAAATFDSFGKEINKPAPQKAVLRALWQGLVTALPSIERMTDTVDKIKNLLT